MLWLYILLGIILLLVLVMLIPVGVRAQLDESFTVTLKIGFVSVRLYPPKPKKPKKPKKKKEKPRQKEKKEPEKEKKPNIIREKGVGWLLDLIWQAAALAGGVLKDFFRHIVIKKLQLSIIYAGTDAQDTAVKYGYLCLSVYPAVSILVRAAHCKSYGVDISPDFTEGARSRYHLDFYARIRVFWVVALVFRHGFKALKLLLSLRRGNPTDIEKYNQKMQSDVTKGEFAMDHPIGNLMNVTMEKIKEMVDVNTIVGEPITSADGTLIIPVSKVSYGFASGGSDLPTKKENKDCFGGGSGAGVTIQPVAFLTVYQGNVRLINVNNPGDGLEKIIDMVPDVVDKVKGFISSRKEKKNNAEALDDFSEITVDDIDV